LDHVYVSARCGRHSFYGKCNLAVFKLQYGKPDNASSRDCNSFGFGVDPTVFCRRDGQEKRKTRNAGTLRVYDRNHRVKFQIPNSKNYSLVNYDLCFGICDFTFGVLLLIVSKSTKLLFITSPVFVHLHIKFEMDLFSKEFF